MSEDKFLLIRNWSFILWADVEHVLSQLLIAELTGRIPVIYWPTHCLHNGFVHTNGFELYFEPVSQYTILDLAKPEYSYYPPIWDADNLLVEDQSKGTCLYRNIGDIICNNSNVVIGDIYIPVYQLIPFINKNHAAYGMTVFQINCYLFRKYIRIKQDIEAEIQGYYNSWLRNEGLVMAVHVLKANEEPVYDLDVYRKKDKRHYLNNPLNFIKKKKRPRKNRKLLEANLMYRDEIKKFIETYNVQKIFLLTNCGQTVKEYQKEYGSMVVFTPCKRMEKDESLSAMDNPMVKRRQGIEIIKDTYLAAKCSFFIGSDCSSLSHAVSYIKDWPKNNLRLLFHNVKNRKYPINIKLFVKREGNKILKRVIGWFKKLFRLD
ncbi:MAG: hypothetical protein EOM54_08835 [Clostridia bacterium]|nr:hypothetical protein [Clostridia bacterium]